MQSISTNWHPSSCFSGSVSVLRCLSSCLSSPSTHTRISGGYSELSNCRAIVKPLSGKFENSCSLQVGHGFLMAFDVFNTNFTKLLSTVCDLVGLSNDLETNWALWLDVFRRWWFHKLTFESYYSLVSLLLVVGVQCCHILIFFSNRVCHLF